MTENTQEQKLDYALKELDDNLLLWGLDNYMGFRTAETMRLSVSGATNLVALVNALKNEILRLEMVVSGLENGN